MVCAKCGNYASHPFCGCPHCGGAVTVPCTRRYGGTLPTFTADEGVTAPEVAELTGSIDIATENHTELTCPWCAKPTASCDCTPRRAMTDKTGQRIAAALEELVKLARPLCKPQLFFTHEEET